MPETGVVPQEFICPALSGDYRVPSQVFDEMCGSQGNLREHWRFLLDGLNALGPEGIAQRWREARRLIRDNGVTYNVYGDPHGVSRPWELDLVPLLIGSEEWLTIERGLAQRAELLDQVFADLYGPRRLLAKGLLPPEFVYAHPGFLRPCDGVTLPGPRRLPFYAADLARTDQGQVWVVGDRVQAPSGAGYALENRIVMSRILPSLFRDSHVHRLAGFFRAMRSALAALRPEAEDPARIVFLTPGPSNEAYFEHAYLANYLGYTLVQGSDLVVRSGRVWLKNLDSLQPVAVILRRLDDSFCDPLELREDSLLGVPGLVQAARGGQVAVVNPLGSGILDHPGLMAFLPRLSRFLLGEDLLLPSVQTWWCGDAKARAYVLANLEQLVIKFTHNGYGTRSVFGTRLDKSHLEELRGRIQASPGDYVAQRQLSLSTTPVLAGARLEARSRVLRTFLVARDDSYVVMPGGLTRVAPAPDELAVSNLLGGMSKDTWVLASEPERRESLLLSGTGRISLRGQLGEVPSRVADNLFWIGRYAERAEGLVRLLRVIILHLTEQSSLLGETDRVLSVHHLLRAVTQQTLTFPGFVGDGAEASLAEPEPELLRLVSEPDLVGGLPQTLSALVQSAWSVRDRLSGDTWRVVGDVEEELRTLGREPPEHLGAALDELDALITALLAFSGLTMENMTHTQTWRFLQIGRRLERAANLATLLRACVVPVSDASEEALLYESLLGVTDSLITYRQRYRSGMQTAPVLDLLMVDETNPRALAYQLVRLEELVEQLPRELASRHRSPEERQVLEALTEVRLADPEVLDGVEEGTYVRTRLDKLLAHIGHLLPGISDAITARYFRHDEQRAHRLYARMPET